MNSIIEKISWIPSNLIKKVKNNPKKFINLDLKKVGVNRKFKFYISEVDEGLSTQLNVFGFREPLNIEYHYKFIEKEDIVLDIGANIGIFTILSENAKKIICIEPLKQAIPILEKNIEANNLSGKTEVINAAIGKKGKLIIEVDKKLNLSRIVDKKNKNTYEIKSFELKYIVKKYNPNTLRLDVEGYEYEILFKKIPEEIKKISIEFHTALLGKKKSKELLYYFGNENFKVKYFIEDLPIRLYPFYNFLKKTKLIKKVTYVKKNLKIEDIVPLITKGRKVKYLFLER